MTPKFVQTALLKVPAVKRRVDELARLRSDNAALRSQIELQTALIGASRSPLLFTSERDFLTERLLGHPAKLPGRSLTLESVPPAALPNRVAVADRLLTAYRSAMSNEATAGIRREGEDLWTGLLRNELPDLLTAVEKGDPRQLAEVLEGFGSKYAWFGGITTCVDGYSKDLDPERVALSYHDKLVSLAEGLGALCLESPESGPWGESLLLDPASVVSAIEDRLGIDLAPPLGIIHTDGIRAGASLLHYRHVNSIYSAARLATVNPLREPVCEIGGGIGLTALYSRRLGLTDYTIFDLPITCLLAGHYLIHALGDDNVRLYGEPESSDAVTLLPFWELSAVADSRFGFGFNQDGLPEMSDNLILEYLRQIRRTARSGFLSINHECFHPRTVDNFARMCGGLRKQYRFKCWVREGYVEELFAID